MTMINGKRAASYKHCVSMEEYEKVVQIALRKLVVNIDPSRYKRNFRSVYAAIREARRDPAARRQVKNMLNLERFPSSIMGIDIENATNWFLAKHI